MKEIHLNVKRSARAMSMCHWHHVTCDIYLEGDIRKYIIAIIQSECVISTGGIKTTNICHVCSFKIFYAKHKMSTR